MNIHFSDLRWPQIKKVAENKAVLVLPIGQIEEHGPHLPVKTDAFIVKHICERAAEKLAGNPLTYILDTVCYGYSQKALTKWPGVFSIPQETLIEVLRHVLISVVNMGFKKIVLVSNHGNHDGVTRVVARIIADECGVGPGLVFPYAFTADLIKECSKAGPKGSCHAGELETSLMLYLSPELVDMSSAVPDDKLTTTLPYTSNQAFISTWTLQRSKSGTYGDPTVATKEFGKLAFEKMVEETEKFIRYYYGLEQV